MTDFYFEYTKAKSEQVKMMMSGLREKVEKILEKYLSICI